MKTLRETADEFAAAIRRDPTFKWLSTGGNVFYPPAAIFLIAPLVAAATGPTTGMHIYAYISMFVLGLVCLVFAGFSEPR